MVGILFFERSSADGHAVDFYFRAGWRAGDAKLLSLRDAREKGKATGVMRALDRRERGIDGYLYRMEATGPASVTS
jgi:hypothetical protein